MTEADCAKKDNSILGAVSRFCFSSFLMEQLATAFFGCCCVSCVLNRDWNRSDGMRLLSVDYDCNCQIGFRHADADAIGHLPIVTKNRYIMT